MSHSSATHTRQVRSMRLAFSSVTRISTRLRAVLAAIGEAHNFCAEHLAGTDRHCHHPPSCANASQPRYCASGSSSGPYRRLNMARAQQKRLPCPASSSSAEWCRPLVSGKALPSRPNSGRRYARQARQWSRHFCRPCQPNAAAIAAPESIFAGNTPTRANLRAACASMHK